MNDLLVTTQDLCLGYEATESISPVLGPLSLEISHGEVHGIIGESGSGKSTLGLYLAGLLHWKSGKRISGTVKTSLTHDEIVYLPQDPGAALDPLCPVGQLFHELGASRVDTEQALNRAQLAGCNFDLRSYPHELSGGMLQRILIASALVRSPRLIIADEPTSSLDVILQNKIVELFRNINRSGITIVFITHNLGLARSFCERVTVLKDGRHIETQATNKLFQNPSGDYTLELIQSVPKMPKNQHE